MQNTFLGKERIPFRLLIEQPPGVSASNRFQTNDNLLLHGCIRGRLSRKTEPFVLK